METIKRCFWLNLFNYKIMMKILEVFLTKPAVLKASLVNCTMFVCLQQSVKVRIQGHLISCYEIFRTMLKHDNTHLLSGPFEDPVRKIEDMPPEIQELAVTTTHPMSSFGLFLPIKKWCDFTVYDKERFEEQLRAVVNSIDHRIHISPENFLVRIPKFFFWNNSASYSSAAPEDGLGSYPSSDDPSSDLDAVTLLRHMIEDNVITEGGDTHHQIITVLN